MGHPYRSFTGGQKSAFRLVKSINITKADLFFFYNPKLRKSFRVLATKIPNYVINGRGNHVFNKKIITVNKLSSKMQCKFLIFFNLYL